MQRYTEHYIFSQLETDCDRSQCKGGREELHGVGINGVKKNFAFSLAGSFWTILQPAAREQKRQLTVFLLFYLLKVLWL